MSNLRAITVLIATLSIPSAFAAIAPPLSNPDVAPEPHAGDIYHGALPGQATVSAGGNASYTIPIELPPGRRGLAPEFEIAYNSNMRNGMLGLGWFLSGTSKITRCPSTLSQEGVSRPVRYDQQDRFCLDGHKLLAVSGEYGADGTSYRTEIDRFASIRSWGWGDLGPRSFTVKTREGLTHYYGHTPDSQMAGETSNVVRHWALNRVQDRASNYYDLSYYRDSVNGEHYIDSVQYTGNEEQGAVPFARIDFHYEGRPDNFLTYEAGSKLRRHPVRLARIETRVDGSLVSNYVLTYGVAGPSELSRLTSVQRCDGLLVAGGSAVNCQDPIQVSWWDDGVTDYSRSTMSVPYFEADSSTHDREGALIGSWYNTPRWHDFNGDGLPDYAHIVPQWDGRYRDSWHDFKIRLSGPDGYRTVTWRTDFGGSPKDFHWMDVNGDGRTDVVKFRKTGAGAPLLVALASDNGFVNDNAYDETARAPNYENMFHDVNGDHLPDIVSLSIGISGCGWNCVERISTSYSVQINNGAGFEPPTPWFYNDGSTGYTIIDVNGDGLVDLLGNHKLLHANDGNSIATTSINVGAPPNSYAPLAYIDVNGDGLLDRRVRRSDGSCCVIQLNTGTTFVTAGALGRQSAFNIDDSLIHDTYSRTVVGADSTTLFGNPPTLGDTKVSVYLNTDAIGKSFQEKIFTAEDQRMNFFHQWTDINGDGLKDYTLMNTEVCNSYQYKAGNWPFIWTYTKYEFCENGQLEVMQNSGKLLNLVRTITQGRGVLTQFTYKPLTDNSVYTRGNSASFPVYDIQDSTHVVSRMQQSNGIGGDTVIDYRYEGLQRDVQGRGDMGFARITSENQATDTTVSTEYAQVFPYTSQPTRVEVYRTSDMRLLGSTATRYLVYGTVGDGPVFPYVSSRVEKVFDLADGRHLATTTTTNHSIDALGNISDTTVEVNDLEAGQTHRTQTLSTYLTDSSWSGWRAGDLLSRDTRAWQDGVNEPGKDRSSSYSYDAATGFLLTETREPGKGAGIEMTETLAYDAYGNVISRTVAGPGLESRTSLINYDARYQFPITLTNPLGHRVRRSWDVRFGKKGAETDANGLTTTWEYNSFGVPLNEARPDGSATTTRYYNCDTPACEALGATTYTEILDSARAPARRFLDLLGRKVRLRTQAFDGRYVNVDTRYNDRGQAWRDSVPYFDGVAPVWNTRAYDHRGRVTALTAADPVSSMSSAYDGFAVAVTDALGRTERRESNALGQIINVIDKVGTAMRLDYDAVGNRVRVTNAIGQASQSSVSYSYDRLGRLTRQDDPDHGVYQYSYDAQGRKLTEQSPNMAAAGQLLRFQYDLLGRLTSRSEPEGTTTWSYDDTTGGNLGLGQLHRESQAGFTRNYDYASFDAGKVSTVTTTIGSDSYVTRYGYDAQGRLATESFPASTAEPTGLMVEYVYSPVGQVEAVQSPGGATVYYQLRGTDAAGRVTEEWLGDGSTVSQGYDGHSSRIMSQRSVIGGSPFQHFSYSYDGAGNMSQRSDQLQGLSEAFSYDDLDRLISATVGVANEVIYNFDVSGNITEKSDVGHAYLYDLPAIHAVQQITRQIGEPPYSFGYDSNGNMQTLNSVPMLTWASYNKPTRISDNGITYQFDYGPDRKRFRKDRNSIVTHYVSPGFEVVKATAQGPDLQRHFIRANGKVVMIREDQAGTTSQRYVHRDHLGSVTALTDALTGTVLERYSYDAWGRRRSAGDWLSEASTMLSARGYTGHEHLDDVGIVHMNGRVYSPSLGRMLSPDPVTQAPENGQNYNRYTYAFNNPLSYTDPSGFCSNGKRETGCMFNDYNSWMGGAYKVTVWSSNPSTPTGVGSIGAFNEIQVKVPNGSNGSKNTNLKSQSATWDSEGVYTVGFNSGMGGSTIALSPSLFAKAGSIGASPRSKIGDVISSSSEVVDKVGRDELEERLFDNVDVGWMPVASTYDVLMRNYRAKTDRNTQIVKDALYYGSMAYGVGGITKGLATLAIRNPRLAFQAVDATVSTTNTMTHLIQFGRLEANVYGQIAPHMFTQGVPKPPLRQFTAELLLK